MVTSKVKVETREASTKKTNETESHRLQMKCMSLQIPCCGLVDLWDATEWCNSFQNLMLGKKSENAVEGSTKSSG